MRRGVPYDLFIKAQCHVLTQLRLRWGWEAGELAKACGIGPSTLRDYERQERLHTLSTPYKIGLRLGYLPEQVAELTRRWLRKYIRRQRVVCGKGADWWPPFPWEQKPCQI